MSSRTAAAHKAIAAAWEKEQELVRQGKGTRDWTPEQQNDILDPERGKAYDADGRAFDGQHMKSVSKYPEYQGNPDNIQFLTRQEHLEAHKGSWQNPSNWYYDPVTKQFLDFAENELIPCKTIKLSNPIIGVEFQSEEPPETDVSHEVNSPIALDSSTTKISAPKSEGAENQKHRIDIKSAFQSAMGTAGQIYTKHKPLIHGTLKFIGVGLAYIGLKAISESLTNGSDENGSSSDSDFDWSSQFDRSPDSTAETITDIEDSIPEETFQKEKRASPAEHTVPGHGQHYWKGGQRIWVEKEDYSRGGKKDEEQSLRNIAYSVEANNPTTVPTLTN